MLIRADFGRLSVKFSLIAYYNFSTKFRLRSEFFSYDKNLDGLQDENKIDFKSDQLILMSQFDGKISLLLHRSFSTTLVQTPLLELSTNFSQKWPFFSEK